MFNEHRSGSVRAPQAANNRAVMPQPHNLKLNGVHTLTPKVQCEVLHGVVRGLKFRTYFDRKSNTHVEFLKYS